jgi:hypothetical protein
MKPVVKVASPAAIAVLRQATALFPKRKKLSDGLLPSLAHQKANPNSDHNTGLAVDLTHDPKGGVDCKEVFEKLKKDKRVKYLIFNGRIWVRGQREKVYTGSNPHRSHLHISINDDYGNDVSPWFAWAVKETKKKPVKKKAAVKTNKMTKVKKKSILLSLFKKGKK